MRTKVYNYPLLRVPPVSQAELKKELNEKNERVFKLNYGGFDIIEITIEGRKKVETRIYSDGTMQSNPLIQQYFISSKQPFNAEVTLHMRKESINLKPKRSVSGEPIQAQTGSPLIYGANGFYGIWEDLMLEWNGGSWNWLSKSIDKQKDGSTSAKFKIHVDNQAFYFLIRPRYYSQHLGYKYFKPWERTPNTKAISGWCSWEAYHRDVTQENVADAAKLMSSLAPYGLEYIQLDDGFQNPMIPPEKGSKIYESWLNTNERFKKGHEGIVGAIKDQGLEPGIWTNAMLTNDEFVSTDLYVKNGEEALKGYCVEYIMNCSDENLTEHVLPYYKSLKEHGYTYFKTDAIRHLCYDGVQECVRMGLMTDEEADESFRRFMEYTRKGIGDEAYLLSCWGILTQSIGLADAFRVGTDATPEWEHIHMQVMETARCFFAQRIMFTLDPDHICARTDLEWCRMLLSFVSLTGGLYMLSDELECYDEARMEMFKKTLPSLEVFTGETGPIDYSTPAFCWSENPSLSAAGVSEFISNNGENRFGSFWITHFNKSSRNWSVVARTPLVPLLEEDVSLEKLCLEPEKKYALYDFWEEEYLGITTQAVKLKALPVGGVQICAVVPVSNTAPTFIASNRHVSMDAVSVLDCKEEKGQITLKLKGVLNDSFNYVFYSERSCKIHCTNDYEVVQDGFIYNVKILFDKVNAEITVKEV